MPKKIRPDSEPTTPELAGRPQRLSLVVYSESVDKIHYAFAMASAAAAVNIPVCLFFTMGAIHALVDIDGRPGWADMTTSEGRTGELLNDDYGSLGVATFDELMEACSALGVRIMVCEMGLRAVNLTREDLRDDIEIAEGGLVTFYSDAGDSPITFL
jgi:peroxiredoxin family protein